MENLGTNKAMKLTVKDYLKLAIPFVLSTVTQPLLSAVDTGVVGHLSKPEYIAGITLGAVIFNTIYWLFGFLRVSTTGFSAQSLTEKDNTTTLIRPLITAMLFGLFFIVLHKPLFLLAMKLMGPEPDVVLYAKKYFDILIYGAPLVFCNYVMLGFLMGKAKVKATLVMQITGNVVNIILDLLFVVVFGFDIAGVAVATLISLFVSTLIGVYYVRKAADFTKVSKAELFDKEAITAIFSTNSDLLIRTACLLTQINIFASVSASYGTAALAANGILLQLQGIMAYLFDGVANASSVYSGKARGAGDITLLKKTMRINNQCTAGLIVLVTVVYSLGSSLFIGLFTNLEEVVTIANHYSIWLCAYPLLAGFALTNYGMFTGASLTKPVRNSTIESLLLFIIVLFTAQSLGNNGLWLAFSAFCLGRTIFLVVRTRQLYQQVEK